MRRHRPALAQELTQRSPLHELHHQEGVSGVAALVVDGDQARVLKAGYRAGLTLEPSEKLVIAGVAGVHHFQCDRTVEPDVVPPVHLGHPAGGDSGFDAVAAVEHSADEVVRRHRPILESRWR